MKRLEAIGLILIIALAAINIAINVAYIWSALAK